MWDAATGRLLESCEPMGDKLALSPDGQQAVGGCCFSQVQVWDLTARRELWRMPHPYDVTSVAWSPDGLRIASASRSQTICVWDARMGRRLLTLRGHRGIIDAVAWSPDSQRLASGGHDGTVRTWDLSKPAQPLVLAHPGASEVAWSPDGSYVASTGDGTLRVWDAHTYREIGVVRAAAPMFAWGPDSQQVAAQTDPHTVTLWDVRTQRVVRTLPLADGRHILVWAPDAPRLAITSDRSVRVHDTTTGTVVREFVVQPDVITASRWSPDGRRLAVGDNGRAIVIWDTATGNTLPMSGLVGGSIDSLSWSSDGRRLASAGWDLPAQIWDATSGERLAAFHGHNRRLNAIAWSPDGQRVASGGEDRLVKVWSPVTGEEYFSWQVPGDLVRGLAWSPGGDCLAATDSQSVILFDASPGRTLTRSVTDQAVGAHATTVLNNAVKEAP
jgi:WD40 repeat protein